MARKTYLSMNKTLVILAAGIGSRFGGGIKQLEPVDDHGHIIIDYSIHDAIAAGFTKIVFIIRHDIEKDFREVIGNRIEKVCAAHKVEVAYAFQELSDIPDFAGKKKRQAVPSLGVLGMRCWPVTDCWNPRSA